MSYVRDVLITEPEVDQLAYWMRRIDAGQGDMALTSLAFLLTEANTRLQNESQDTWGLTSLTNSIRSLVSYLCHKYKIPVPHE